MNFINITIEVNGTWCNNWPNFKVQANGHIYIDQPIENHQIFKFSVPDTDHNTLTLSHYGKSFGQDNIWDTRVENEKIVQDRAIKLIKLELNEVDITKYISKWPFETDTGEILHTDYFGHNGQLEINFTSPVYDWIILNLVKESAGPDTAQDLILETSHGSVFDYAQDLVELEQIDQLLAKHAHLFNKSS